MRRLSKTINSSLLLFVVWTMCSCDPQKMNISEIPVPAGASKGVARPELGTQVNGSANLILLDVKDRLGAFDDQIYTLSKPSEWQQIANFYDEKLVGNSFERTSHVPSAPIDSDIIYYEQRGVSANHKIAVALIKAVDHATKNEHSFLLLCASK